MGLQPSQEAVLLGTVDATSKARPAPREVEGSAALIARATKPSLVRGSERDRKRCRVVMGLV